MAISSPVAGRDRPVGGPSESGWGSGPAWLLVELDLGAERAPAVPLGRVAVQAIAEAAACARGLHQRLVCAHDVALRVVEELVDQWACAGPEKPGHARHALDTTFEGRG